MPLAQSWMAVPPFCADLAEQDAGVGEDADRIAVQVGKAGDQRRAEARLELVELRAVDDARDHLAHVVGLAQVVRHQPVELLGGVFRLGGRPDLELRPLDLIERADDAPRERERVVVVLGEVVGDAGDARARRRRPAPRR